MKGELTALQLLTLDVISRQDFIPEEETAAVDPLGQAARAEMVVAAFWRTIPRRPRARETASMAFD